MVSVSYSLWCFLKPWKKSRVLEEHLYSIRDFTALLKHKRLRILQKVFPVQSNPEPIQLMKLANAVWTLHVKDLKAHQHKCYVAGTRLASTDVTRSDITFISKMRSFNWASMQSTDSFSLSPATTFPGSELFACPSSRLVGTWDSDLQNQCAMKKRWAAEQNTAAMSSFRPASRHKNFAEATLSPAHSAPLWAGGERVVPTVTGGRNPNRIQKKQGKKCLGRVQTRCRWMKRSETGQKHWRSYL